MLKSYVVYYKYKCPGDKKPGAVKQYRMYAANAEEARRIAAEQGNYPDVEVLKVQLA